VIAGIFLEKCQRQRSDAIFGELKELAERTHQPNAVIHDMACESTLATLGGRFEEAAAFSRRILERGEEFGMPAFAAFSEGLTAWADRILSADDQEVSRRLADPLIGQNPAISASLLARLGRDAEVVEILERQVVARPGFGSAGDYTPIYADLSYLSSAVAVRHREAARMLLDKLATIKPKFVAFIGCVPQRLGEAAAFLGKHAEARAWYEDAIRVNTDMGVRFGIALSRLGLAELLLDHYPAERKDALEHLDFAIKEFREMKMQPSLERALRHKEILKA
jgi:tetratricopeptide (TPR) repeat protein